MLRLVLAAAPPAVLEAVEAQPGRLVMHDHPLLPLAKPGPDDSPFRSRFYVSSRHSADGNFYRRGEPIPEAEEERQAAAIGAGRPLRIPRATCPRCRGSRRRNDIVPKGHQPGCPCPACATCPRCNGTGYVAV